MKTIKYSKLLLKTAILTSIGYSCFAQTSDTTFINFNKTYQVIDGFGASSANGVLKFGNFTLTDAQADMFFSPTKGIGLSLLRNMCFDSCNVKQDSSTPELPVMRQAQARGARCWSTTWSPLDKYKSNNNDTCGNFLSQYEQDYANEFAYYVSTMKDSGINLYAVSIQNEPGCAPWGSCYWTPQQMHDFVPYLYNALQSKGVGSTKIMASEESNWAFDEVADILSDPTTDTMLGICAAHGYNFPDPPAMFSTNGQPVWETEVCNVSSPLDSSIADGLFWANNINQYMTVANANAWHYWWLARYTTDNESLADSSGHLYKRGYVLGNFSKFVRPGYLRVDDTLGPSGVALSAYEDTANGAFAIVAINNNDTATPIVVSLNGLSASTVTPWITSGTLDLIEQQNVAVSNSSFSYSLPDSSVTTFVYSGTTTGINKVNPANNNISVYPNPAQNEITIAGLDAALKNQIVRVYSSIGQLVYENEISGTTRYTLNLAGYAPGMYCIFISNAQGDVVKKVMIAK